MVPLLNRNKWKKDTEIGINIKCQGKGSYGMAQSNKVHLGPRHQDDRQEIESESGK
jgi:hypothetical protein